MPPKLKLSKGTTSASGLTPITLEAWYTPDRAGAPTVTVDLRMVYDLDVLQLSSATAGAVSWQDPLHKLGTVAWQNVSLSDGEVERRTAHFSWINPRILETTVHGHLDIGAVASVSSTSVVLDQPAGDGSGRLPDSGADRP